MEAAAAKKYVGEGNHRHWRLLRIRSRKNLFGPPVNVTGIRIEPNELCAVQSISTDHNPNIAYEKGRLKPRPPSFSGSIATNSDKRK